MNIDGEKIIVRFILGNKKKVRKLATNASAETIQEEVSKCFPLLKEYEAFYKEYMIESAEDLESAVEEFKSNDSRPYWFDIKLSDPNAPPIPKKPPVQKVTVPVIVKPAVQSIQAPKVPTQRPPQRQRAPAPAPARPVQQPPPNVYSQPQPVATGASYAPHKHLGQMTPDQRVLHKLVWGLSGGAWMRPADLRKKLPGKKKPNKQLITNLMNKGISFGYFLHENGHYHIGPNPIPFDDFVPAHCK